MSTRIPIKGWRRKYTITGWPCLFLCVIPMIIGWVEVIKWIIQGAF